MLRVNILLLCTLPVTVTHIIHIHQERLNSVLMYFYNLYGTRINKHCFAIEKSLQGDPQKCVTDGYIVKSGQIEHLSPQRICMLLVILWQPNRPYELTSEWRCLLLSSSRPFQLVEEFPRVLHCHDTTAVVRCLRCSLCVRLQIKSALDHVVPVMSPSPWSAHAKVAIMDNTITAGHRTVAVIACIRFN